MAQQDKIYEEARKAFQRVVGTEGEARAGLAVRVQFSQPSSLILDATMRPLGSIPPMPTA
jgi:hypothetical protein